MTTKTIAKGKAYLTLRAEIEKEVEERYKPMIETLNEENAEIRHAYQELRDERNQQFDDIICLEDEIIDLKKVQWWKLALVIFTCSLSAIFAALLIIQLAITIHIL